MHFSGISSRIVTPEAGQPVQVLDLVLPVAPGIRRGPAWGSTSARTPLTSAQSVKKKPKTDLFSGILSRIVTPEAGQPVQVRDLVLPVTPGIRSGPAWGSTSARTPLTSV